MDFLGQFLRLMPDFRGRGRLTHHWLVHSRLSGSRLRRLPGGAVVECRVSVPYEAMVWLGREEQDDLLTLRRLLRPGQTFVDCGANIGLWSLVAAATVGPAGHVVAFEPNPQTYTRLIEHILRNSLTGIVTAHQLGCSEADERLPLCCAREHNISRIVDAPGAGTVFVPITTLDRTLGQTEVHGIKIDVEGHERSVLLGAEKLLRRCHPWLCVEFNSQFATSSRLGDWNVHQQLVASGYRCRLFSGGPELPAGWIVRGYANLFYWKENV